MLKYEDLDIMTNGMTIDYNLRVNFMTDILYHFICKKYEDEENYISYISTYDQLAYIMAKAISCDKFQCLCNLLTISSLKEIQTLYMIPMQTRISSKIVLWKLSCTSYRIGWCSLTIPHLAVPIYIVAFLKHYPCNHHIFFSSTSQHLNKYHSCKNPLD